MRRIGFAAIAALASAACLPAHAQTTLPSVTVTTRPKQAKPSAGETLPSLGGSAADLPKAVVDEPPYSGATLLDKAQSGSEGVVPREQLLLQPTYRTGEMLETVPGLVVTQHSGEGKANQYFLRGFNLDHGTDIAITVDSMPVNMRTHGHGQGYADTNFMIPEIMRGLTYRKGPYFASEGDFASAGAIHLGIVDRLDANFAQVEVGSFGHRRAVGGMSVPAGDTASVLAAIEMVRFDGPWERPDDLRKLNGVLRYSQGSYNNGFSITGMGYSGQWFSTDQIPLRAVEDGSIGLFGTMDPTDGGRAQRFSLSGRWSEKTAESQTQANAYVIQCRLALFNNFTYFLDNETLGDQFKQSDSRVIGGAAASKTFFGTAFGGMRSDTTFGVQSRYDDIDVGLFKTDRRVVYATVREDHVRELSVGAYAENTLRWTPWLRSTAGLRADIYTVDVGSNLAANSGNDLDTMLSPKFGLVLGPWARTELYLNAGSGFHSNDARGTVITVDPNNPAQPVPSIPLLVRSKGAEIGLRSEPSKSVQSTLAAFILDFDSEIVFVGDAGNTEASRPSRRVGVEYTLRALLLPWLMFDLSAAYTHARFLEDDPLAPGRFIPGATEGVVTAGLSFGEAAGGWFGNLKVRYFGPRPLIEDNSERSKSSSPVSARLGYRFGDGLTVRVDGFNLLNQQASQIDYFYASRLSTEPSGVGTDDIHFHPLEPRSFRLSLVKQW